MKYATQTKHGDASRTNGKKRVWVIWTHMRSRCKDFEDPLYGGRGIKVCDEWQDYQTFKEWSLNNGYADDLSIDRKNVNGNYEPTNCRWATMKVQQRNRRNNRILTFNGQSQTIAEWSDATNISASLISARINKLGWSVERTLTEPVRKRNNTLC